MDRKQRILEFIQTQKLGVVSTIGENGPESAVVAFGETDKLELYFGTSNASRKYRNLKRDPRVAFVIGWDDERHLSVQYEGVAKEIGSGSVEYYQSEFARKNPATAQFMPRPDQRYFLVTPTWIRWVSREETYEIFF